MAILLNTDWANSACFQMPPTQSHEPTEIRMQPFMNDFVVTLQLTASDFQVCLADACLLRGFAGSLIDMLWPSPLSLIFILAIGTKLTDSHYTYTGLGMQQAVRSAPAVTKAAIQDFLDKWHRRRNDRLTNGKGDETLVRRIPPSCALLVTCVAPYSFP